MGRTRMLPALVVASALAAMLAPALLPAAAGASATQESVFQDDNQLVYASSDHVEQVLQQLQALGVERIRVSVIWSLIAPDPLSSTEPSFNAADPAAYPAGAWDRYDTLVTDAQQLGIGLDFNVTAPAPYWATKRPPANVDPKFRKVYDPNPYDFGQFVEAVATRYSGTYVTHTMMAPPPPTQPTLLGLPLPNLPILSPPPPPPPPEPTPLPKVGYWEIWNEPNEAGWLSPQWRPGPKTKRHQKTWIENSPVMYRALADQAADALAATGHSGDTVLVGNTSAKGASLQGLLPAIPPLTFVKALYCVGGNYRPLTGTRAGELDCPLDGSTSAFDAEHPELIHATGYGHHPYSFKYPPNLRSTNPAWATMADLPRFESALNRIMAVHGDPRPNGVPLYLTEYGYKSNPPNPFVHTSPAQQAAYINEGEYLAWSYPFVSALGQFELVDAGPEVGEPIGSPAYWGTFQTGLVSASGAPKPSLFAYRIPIWVPDPRHGAHVTVWGQLRPANHSAVQTATIEFQPHTAGAFVPLTQIETASPQGFILSHVSIPGPGFLRIAWPDPATGQVYHSRIVTIR